MNVDIMQVFYIAAGLLFGGYALNRFTDYRKVAVREKSKQTNIANVNTANPLAKFESFHDLASNMANGLDMQCQEIMTACNKGHIDYMKDTGYITVKKQYDTALAWKTRLENPLWSMADGMFYPLAREFGTGLVKQLPALMKGVGSFV